MAAAFLAAAALLATVDAVAVFLAVAFLPLTMVVPLLPALASLLRPFSVPSGGALAVVLAPARLAFPVRLTAPAREIVFFSGERLEDLKGAGGFGRVRELLERGDSTPAGFVVPGSAAFRPAVSVRVALELAVTVAVVAFARFLGLGSSSFSLSAPSNDNVEISSLDACQLECSIQDRSWWHTPLAFWCELSLSAADGGLHGGLCSFRRDGHGHGRWRGGS